MARRKVVSDSKAFCACMRRRQWRQLAISIQAVSTLNALTSQNKPLPITPSEAR